MTDLICRKTMMRCQTQGMCAPFGGCQPSVLADCKTAQSNSRDTPSPAGVDGLEVVALWYADDDLGRAVDYVKIADGEGLCRLSDATAIIDGLAVENHQLQRELNLRQSQIESSGRIAERAQRFAVQLRTERDQQAPRIGELEGLLGETLEDMTNELWQRIDATLSAGKEVE